MTSRRPGAAVDHGRHEPVVLVAEVRRQPGPLAERAGAGERRERRDAERAGDDVGPARGSPGRRRSATIAQTSTWASNTGPATTTTTRCRPARRARRAPRRRRGTRGSTAAGRARAGRPARACRTARARNSTAASAYGPPPWRARAAAGRRRRQLRQVRRVADDDVDAPGQPRPSASPWCSDASSPASATAAAARLALVDVDADEHRAAAELAHPSRRGGEEATVAARRVDHDDVARRRRGTVIASATTRSTSHGGVG